MRTLVTLGHGYSAAALAARLSGWRVRGTIRDAARGDALRRAGVEPIDWSDRQEVDLAIGTADAVLASMPPGAEGDPALARHAAALAAAPARWVGYLSTTGVYGDRQGAWVTEDAALQPAGERGRRRVAAEAAWAATGLPLHVFRLAGIYGPGRSILDRVRVGEARRIVRPGQVFSRIHVADVGAVLAASLAHPRPGRAYNVADDLPSSPADVTTFACQLLGMPLPPEEPFDAATLSPMAASFWSESKRVSNRRIKAELGIRLAFPTYREGLAAVLAAGG